MRALALIVVLSACPGTRKQGATQGSASSAEATKCDELSPPKENELRLTFKVSQRDLTTECIPPGGWESYASGPTYDPQLKNCSSAVFEAAKTKINPARVIREVLRKNSALIHFTGPNPQYYEVSYEWLERSRVAVLSIANYTAGGSALNDESLVDLIKVVEAAFRCR